MGHWECKYMSSLQAEVQLDQIQKWKLEGIDFINWGHQLRWRWVNTWDVLLRVWWVDYRGVGIWNMWNLLWWVPSFRKL